MSCPEFLIREFGISFLEEIYSATNIYRNILIPYTSFSPSLVLKYTDILSLHDVDKLKLHLNLNIFYVFNLIYFNF